MRVAGYEMGNLDALFTSIGYTFKNHRYREMSGSEMFKVSWASITEAHIVVEVYGVFGCSGFVIL